MPKTIVTNLSAFKKEMHRYEKNFRLKPNWVQLLLVTKKQSVENIRICYAQGMRQFGENYLQEALPKISALKALSLEWHFIGAIQSNKIKKIAENFMWVQTITSFAIAEKFNFHRQAYAKKLNICLQINLNDENTKSGIALKSVRAMILACMPLSNLQLRGLMIIPAVFATYAEQVDNFKKIQTEFASLQKEFPFLDTLSMGMSQDYVAAIACGSTMVRIGTAVFGHRLD